MTHQTIVLELTREQVKVLQESVIEKKPITCAEANALANLRVVLNQAVRGMNTSIFEEPSSLSWQPVEQPNFGYGVEENDSPLVHSRE